MKILVVSDVYPPHHVGGYELGCRDVVEKLKARGHQVRVLTSTFQTHASTSEEPGIERSLQFNMLADDAPHDKSSEIKIFCRALKRFEPDVVYFWNQAGLSFWLPFTAHWLGCRTVFFLSDTNFNSWRIGAWLAGAAAEKPLAGGSGRASAHAASEKNLRRLTSAATGKLLRAIFGKTFLVRGWPVIQNGVCHFASEFLRQVAVKNEIAFAPRASIVAHWGVEQPDLPPSTRARWPLRRLLFVGQLIAQKGVHTAIAALGLLAAEKQFSELTFTIAGGGYFPDYENELRAQVKALGLEARVNFLGKVPRAELTHIYAEHDVLVFPSEWDEPFAITPLEAAHAGLAIIGTTTGGSGELFRNRETAMTFRAGDAADCARAIRELSTDRELFEKISFNLRLEVRGKHTLEAMVDKIEKNLKLET